MKHRSVGFTRFPLHQFVSLISCFYLFTTYLILYISSSILDLGHKYFSKWGDWKNCSGKTIVVRFYAANLNGTTLIGRMQDKARMHPKTLPRANRYDQYFGIFSAQNRSDVAEELSSQVVLTSNCHLHQCRYQYMTFCGLVLLKMKTASSNNLIDSIFNRTITASSRNNMREIYSNFRANTRSTSFMTRVQFARPHSSAVSQQI